MKIKVRVSVPDFITEVDVEHMSNQPEYDRQRYAEDVAFERFADKMREREQWFDSGDLIAKVEK